MSQQHAVVSQMSRLVSLRTPSRGDGVAAPPRRAPCTHAPSSRKHALALNPRKGVMCMHRADRAGSSATTALFQGGAQRRGGPFFARGLPSVGSQRWHKEAPAGGKHPQKGVYHRPGEDGAHGTARRATVRLRRGGQTARRGTRTRALAQRLATGDKQPPTSLASVFDSQFRARLPPLNLSPGNSGKCWPRATCKHGNMDGALGYCPPCRADQGSSALPVRYYPPVRLP